MPGQQNAAAIEHADQHAFGRRQRSHRLIGDRRSLPGGAIVADQAADESRKIGRDRIRAGGRRIDEARHFVAAKEHVIVPNVAEAGRERHGHSRGEAQLAGDRRRGPLEDPHDPLRGSRSTFNVRGQSAQVRADLVSAAADSTVRSARCVRAPSARFRRPRGQVVIDYERPARIRGTIDENAPRPRARAASRASLGRDQKSAEPGNQGSTCQQPAGHLDESLPVLGGERHGHIVDTPRADVRQKPVQRRIRSRSAAADQPRKQNAPLGVSTRATKPR